MDLLERMPDIEWGYPYKSFDRRRHAKNLKGYRFRDSEGRRRSVAALRVVNQARRHEYTVFGVTDSEQPGEALRLCRQKHCAEALGQGHVHRAGAYDASL